MGDVGLTCFSVFPAATVATVGGGVVTAAGVIKSIKGWTDYEDQLAAVTLRMAKGSVHWTNGTIDTESDYSTGSTSGSYWKQNGDNGYWSDVATEGLYVSVGDQLRTAFESHLTAQNMSWEFDKTDVDAKLGLDRQSGYSHDLRIVEYEWK